MKNPAALYDFLQWAASEGWRDALKIGAWMTLGSVLTMIAVGRKRA